MSCFPPSGVAAAGPAGPVYVDLLQAPDYIVVDSAAFDPTFWQQNQAELQATARSYNKELSPRTAAPAFAVKPIGDMPTFNGWVALDHAASPLPAAGGAAPAPGPAAFIVAGLGLAAAGGIIAWMVLR